MDYRTLAEVLAMELGHTQNPRTRRAQRAGQKWAARIAVPPEMGADVAEDMSHADADDVLDRVAADATVAFTWMGFAPELMASTETPPSADSGPAPGRERTIRMHACPVRDLAWSRPEVVCATHLGILQGLLDKSAADEGLPMSPRPMRAHLEPFVEPRLCAARLVAGE